MEVMDRPIKVTPVQRRMAAGCVNRVRVGFRLPEAVLEILDERVEHLGVTRSAGLSLAMCEIIDGHRKPVLVPPAMEATKVRDVQVTLNPSVLDRLDEVLLSGGTFESQGKGRAFAEAILAWAGEDRL